MNKTAEREAFRMWVCENAGTFDIEWDPADRRSTTNTLPAKYTSDALLADSARLLIGPDVDEWMGKLQEAYPTLQITLTALQADTEEIVPVTNYKGRGVTARYGNGNWAYAEVPVTATVGVVKGDTTTEGYVTMDCTLVSGQLKKPSHIGDLGYTMTGFKTELTKDIPAFTEATKQAEDAKEAERTAKKEADKLAKQQAKAESKPTETPVETPAEAEPTTGDTQESKSTGTTRQSGLKHKVAEAVEA
jgi:Sec-independent protein translocase protein TatA